MDSRASAKPVFGPKVTLELFESRWYSRLDSVINEYLFQNRKFSSTATVAEVQEIASGVWNMTSAWFTTGLFCIREQKALGLTRESLPPRVDRLNTSMGYRNVFDLLETVQGVVNMNITHWMEAKAGKRLFGNGVSWQQLPLAMRRRVNELIEQVEEAKKAEEWDSNVDDKMVEDGIRQRCGGA